MKIADPETIDENLKDIVDNINAELDWDAIEKLFHEKHKLTLKDTVDYKNGSLVVYNNNVAYRFDFDIKVPLSVIFNREGECLELAAAEDDTDFDLLTQQAGEEASDAVMAEGGEKDARSNTVSRIADMISEINREEEE